MGLGLIWEGQFTNRLLTFGRIFKVHLGEIKLVYYGYLKFACFHGYGRMYMDENLVGQGLFEWNDYMPDKKKIEEYNPDTDPIAQEVDLDKYIAASIDEINPPVPEPVIDDLWLNAELAKPELAHIRDFDPVKEARE